jgi:hypothetical protein
MRIKAGYLDAHNTTYGFQPTAIVHSLPQVSFIWAMLLFAIQGFWIAFSDLPTGLLLPVIIPVAVVLAITSLGIWIALHPREKIVQDTPASSPVPPSIPTSEKGHQPTVEAMV